MTIEDVVSGGLVIAFLALVIWFIVAGCVIIPADNYCVERGWHGASVTFSFKRFCESRINNTDVLVPLEKAENRLKLQPKTNEDE